MPRTVLDAGPLIHLDQLGCLDLLEGFSELLVPPVVWQEALRHRPSLSLDSNELLRRVISLLPTG